MCLLLIDNIGTPVAGAGESNKMPLRYFACMHLSPSYIGVWAVQVRKRGLNSTGQRATTPQ